MRNIGMAPVCFRNGSNSAFARSISAACAAVVCATRLGEQARQKRNIHGAILIAYRGGTDKGPSGSMIHLGAFLRIPGDAGGRISLKAKAPALPADALAAGASRSNTTTDSRRACAAIAAESPMTPAPITITSVSAINAHCPEIVAQPL